MSTVVSLICLGPSFQKMTHHFSVHGSLRPTNLEKNLKPCNMIKLSVRRGASLISGYPTVVGTSEIWYRCEYMWLQRVISETWSMSGTLQDTDAEPGLLDYNFPCQQKLCCLMITFSNSLDPVQTRLNIWPDLDPNCLTLLWHIYNSWNNFLKTSNLKKISRRQKSCKIYSKDFPFFIEKPLTLFPWSGDF